MTTKVTSAAIEQSTIDSTVIGQSAAAQAFFTSETVSGLSSLTNVSVSTSASVPTVAQSANGSDAVTTAWSKTGFAVSLAANGYIKLPTWLGGLVLQWGSANAASSSQAVSFPTAFPTNVWAVVCTPLNFGPNAGRASPYLDAVSLSGFTQTSAGSTNSIFFIAIGN